MIYIWMCVLLLAVIGETALLILGKERVKKILKQYLEEKAGENRVDFSHGLYDVEANDFIQFLKRFFGTVTLAKYEVDKSGWINITYVVEEMKVQEREAVKKAICIELHSYLLQNRGVDYWGYFVPVLTDDAVMIKIAASEMAEKQFHNLVFEQKDKKSVPLVEE